MIIIDDLDTGWVHDSVRYKLVRALIETLKKFKRISNVKIVIGLRVDLLETVLKKTTTAGFQTEKFEDMMLRISWSKSELMELADRRIAHLFRDQYTKVVPKFYDIFSPHVGSETSFDYMLDRTLFRPRDVISFMNECIDQAADASSVSQKSIRNGEQEYSNKRLRSLADEWRSTYGDLENAIGCLRQLPVRFGLHDISDDVLENLCIIIVAGDQIDLTGGVFAEACNAVVNNGGSYSRLRRSLVETLYAIGAIGVKMRKGSPYQWSYRNDPLLAYDNLTEDSGFATHPKLFRALNKRADPSTLV